MSEHTKEPWGIVKYASVAVEAHTGRGICSTGGYTDTISGGAYHDENDANARRIVDCVNALAGIPDPAAYVQAMGAIWHALEGVIDATSSYLPSDGISKDECISRVLQASDNAEVFAALQAARATMQGDA